MQTPSTDSSTPAIASSGLSARAARTWDLINKSGIVMVFIILFAALSFTVPDFLSSRNIQGLLLSVTLIGSISVTMMFVLALGEV
ncbi:MAG: L-arabinose ABC transporter permease AraH, partial [Paraburkholderia nemoris]